MLPFSILRNYHYDRRHNDNSNIRQAQSEGSFADYSYYGCNFRLFFDPLYLKDLITEKVLARRFSQETTAAELNQTRWYSKYVHLP